MNTPGQIQEFSESLNRVRGFLRTCPPPTASPTEKFTAFELFLRKPESRATQAFLGIHLCGFIFRNPASPSTELLFQPAGPRFRFPVFWENLEADRFTRLIEELTGDREEIGDAPSFRF